MSKKHKKSTASSQKPQVPIRRNDGSYCEIRTSRNSLTTKPEFHSRRLKSFGSVKKLRRHLYDFEYGTCPSLDSYLSSLCKFCNFLGLSPDQLVLSDSKSLKEYLKALHDMMTRQGLSLRYAQKTVQCVKTFLRCNGIDLEVELPKIPPRYRNRPEYIPTPQEAKKMMEHAGNLKHEALVGTLAFSGLRNSTLRALQYGRSADPNFPNYSIRLQLERHESVLAIVVHPEMKRLVQPACKGKIPYFTFIPKFVTEKLKAYLNYERTKLGTIDDEALLFPTADRRISAKQRIFTPLSSKAVSLIVKRAAENAGLPKGEQVTPQSLRKTFKMWLINQPQAIRLPFEDREFLMGHIPAGTVDEYYDKTRIEELKERFSRLTLSEADYNRAVVQSVCTLLNIDFVAEYEELKKKLNKEPSLSEMGEIIRRKLRPKQKIVPLGEVPNYLEEGWRWVTKYDDETAILEKSL